MRSEAFLPPLLMAYDREKPWKEWLAGSVLFADVSGFTPMSEALSVLGAEGGEVLTDVLNRYFAAMIGIVHAHGGQVMKFGGDAILCFFPEAESRKSEAGEESTTRDPKPETRNSEAPSLAAALQAARRMQGEMSRFQSIRTPVKRFALKMKIGLAHGECLLAGVGDPSVRCDYVFAGAPVDATSDAEHHATAGEIVFAGEQYQLQNANCTMEEVEPGIYRILDVPSSPVSRLSSPASRPSAIGHRPSAVSSYLIREIHAMVAEGFGNQVGALLDIVPVFLRFKGFEYAPGKFDLARFHAFFTLVMEITHRYGGRLNRISMGDKGSTFFILFGAPNALEKKEELACQWALDLQQEVGAQFQEVALGVGMNAGRVFAGIVGGAGRSEYTVMGDAVNFAARLMQVAEERQVCASQSLANPARSIFSFEELGKRKFKGKAEPLPVYSLQGRRDTRRDNERSERLVGRSKELERILHRLKEAAEGRPGMGIIEGEPGTGKSFLASHILDEAQACGWRIVRGYGEITRRNHPYAPWVEVLAQALFHGQPPTVEALERSLDEESRPYLQWHAELFGLSHSGVCEAPSHDEETRKRLFQHQLSRIILRSVTGSGPTAGISPRTSRAACIFLDDLHWFDTLSMELLRAALNHLTREPVFILVTTRPNWEKKDFQGRSDCLFLPLGDLDREGTAELAAGLLGGKARESLIDTILQKTQGNPFFTRQYLLFLKQEGLLESRLGEWLMKRGMEEKADLSASDILSAQVNRLSLQEQVHLKFAACMGPTLSLPILQRAMGTRFRNNALNGLLASGYLSAQNSADSPPPTLNSELRTVSFPHALIQEALYNASPQRERRRTHRRIAMAMEEFLKDSLGSYYPNLANHFTHAGVRRKAIEYSIKAAENLANALSFPEACAYYKRAFHMLRYMSNGEKCRIGISYAEALLKAGNPNECKSVAISVRRNAVRLCIDRCVVQGYILQFDAMQIFSDWRYTKDAQKLLCGFHQPKADETALIRYFLGVALCRKGSYDSALGILVSIHKNKEIGVNAILRTYNPIAAIWKTRGRYAEAIRYLNEGINLANENGNSYLGLRLKIEFANVLIESADLSQAEIMLKESILQAEKVGDYYLIANITYNLGKLALQRMHLESAENYLTQSIGLCSNLGIINGRANGLLHLGIVRFYQNNYEASYALYLDAVRLFESIGEAQDICHSCYDLAEVCMVLNRRSEALRWYSKGTKMMKQIENPALLQAYRDLEKQLNKT